MTIKDYQGKKVAILGLSVEGVDSAKFFTSAGAHVFGCDQRSQDELGPTYTDLRGLGVQFHLGENYLHGLDQFDLLVRTPGMALFLPELVAAHKKGSEITSLTKLFFKHCPAPIIGVTGTKGKGTTSTLIAALLKAAGFTTWLGGNVGQPLLSQVTNIVATDKVVLELSSFQLEDLTQSPQIAVILGVTQEHLANFDPIATNYHRTQTDYVMAKANLVKYQKPENFAVFNWDNSTSRSFVRLTPAHHFYFSKTEKVTGAFVQGNTLILHTDTEASLICKTADVTLKGSHNWENVMAAAVASSLAGVPLSVMQHIIPAFKGQEHRLEFVAEINDVTYYNDSAATTPEATIAAIRAFSEPIVLIVGGSDKGIEFQTLGAAIVQSNVKTVILMGQMGARIRAAITSAAVALKQPSPHLIEGAENMAAIVSQAQTAAQPGSIVLLSPACASFDMFKNYRERGMLFKRYVKGSIEKI